MMVDLLVVNNFKPGEDVIKEGSEGDRMYIVAGVDKSVCVCVCVYLQLMEDFILK